MISYLKSAPEALVELHRGKKIHQGRVKYEGRAIEQITIQKGRDILERLVTDPAMNKTWDALKRKVTTNAAWHRFFAEIVVISRQARKQQPLRRTMRENFLDIAKHANQLADSIAEGRLDRLLYEFFPADSMAIAGAADWADRDTMWRSEFAHKLLPHWPSVPDLLRELGNQATRLTDQVMIERRIVERIKYKPEALYFVRELVAYCKREFASPLYGPVTDIANVGLDYDVTLDFVKKATRLKKAMRRKGT